MRVSGKLVRKSGKAEALVSSRMEKCYRKASGSMGKCGEGGALSGKTETCMKASTGGIRGVGMAPSGIQMVPST